MLRTTGALGSTTQSGMSTSYSDSTTVVRVCLCMVPYRACGRAVQYNCEDIAAASTFQLVTNNFIAGGGDSYTMLPALPRTLSFGPSLADALADYIEMNTAPGSVVRPGVFPP